MSRTGFHFPFWILQTWSMIYARPMKKLILAITFLLCAFPTLFAGTNPDAQQLFLAATQQANIFDDKAGPLQLDVDFVAQIQVPVHGHLTLKREAEDRWWRRIVIGNFEQVDIKNGEKTYTVRNGNFTPIKIGELISLLQFADEAEGLPVKKQKQRTENGVEMNCLQMKLMDGRVKPQEVCVNTISHEIMTEAWEEFPDEHRRAEYSEYFGFGEHRYPRQLALFVNGSKAITATVNSLTANPFDQALLASAPPGAIERRECAGMKHPVPIKTPDPQYPKSAVENKMIGDITVSMTVLTDGSVADIQFIGRATHSMDEATLRTLKSWKFKPAMCGTEPVVSDVEVQVSFRLR